MAEKRRKDGQEEGSPNKYKLPYGLAKGLGLSTEGMTPTEVWNMLKGKGYSPKEEYAKLGEDEDKSKYLKHEDIATLNEIATEKVENPVDVKPALVDNETVQRNKDDEDKFSQDRKDKAVWCKSIQESVKKFGEWQKEQFTKASKEEIKAQYKYTSGSGSFNRPLRGYAGGWGKYNYKGVGNVPLNYEGSGKEIKLLTDFIDRSASQEDIWLQRGDSFDGAKQLLGLTGTITEEKVQDIIDKGKKLTDHGFISCGTAKGTGFSYNPVTFNIYAPKGTKMLYVEGHSAYNGENEMILQRGTKYRATKVSKDSSGRLYIDLEVVEQNPIDLSKYKK